MTDPDREIWERMLAHLRANHAMICRQWFEEIEPMGIANGVMQLRTLSALHRDYLKRQCSEQFNDAARSVTGRLLPVKFLGPEDEVIRPPQPAPKKSEPRAASKPVSVLERTPEVKPLPPRVEPAPEPHHYESLVVNPDCSFENFVVGPGNRLAHAAALAVAASPGRAYNPFFVHGGVGLGTTHLLQAVCLKIAETNPRARLYYTSCEGFVTQFLQLVQAQEMAEFRHRFRDVDVLVIDDIHFLAKRDRSQEEFFHTFNTLYQANKQIIFSSDAAPEEIPDLEDRLVSRFKWGLVAKIEPPCYETRMAIVKTKARLRGLTIPDEVAAYIAQHINTNIRELEGAVVKLQIQSAVDKRPIDMEMARAAVGESAPQVVGEPTIQNIISTVTEFYSIRLADLQGKHRQRSIALPRQVCMYLSRKCTRHSLEEIGGFFGGRDHTTVMHAIRTVDSRRADDHEFDLIVRSLEEKVRNGAASS
jgi:chromosomal replication initiator protein